MDEIGFPQNLPNEFKAHFVAAFNEINRLKEEVNSLKRIMFGQKSERYISEELISPNGTLFNEPEKIIAEESIEKDSTNNKSAAGNSKPLRKPGGKKPLPDNLPREVKIHDLTEEEKICKNDLTQMVKIGEDVVEKLAVVPASMKVIEHRYLKYACPCCEQNVLKAKAEPAIIPASIPEPSLLAHVATNKFLFALPLYRQEILFNQKEINIPRISLARWMIACGNAVLPLVGEIKKYIYSQPVAHCDETPVQVLSGTGKDATAKTYMWVMASGLEAHPAIVFQYYSSRGQKSANDFLNGFEGFLQADGYDGYNIICEQSNVTRIGCWAHVRRKFETAFKDGAQAGKSLSEKFLEEIKKLFLVERDAIPLTIAGRVALRQEKSQPIISAIRNLIDENVNKILPRSKLGTAFGYISSEWPHLTPFLKNGFISLSNNRAENAIRPFAIGRKNWLFSDTVEGAEASAALYSLVITAKENKLHVEDYLEDVFTQLPYLLQKENPSFTSLLPWNWKKIRPEEQSADMSST